MKYIVNRGVGKPVEFKGLKAQYLFIFSIGLFMIIFLVMVLYMGGINQVFCIIFGIFATSILVYLVFHLNQKYGEHGLMKLAARKRHPDFIINRESISKLFPKK
ncbi:DUF4133 domain-containing protein [Butyricimonas sp.]|uniref:DUF4133 domain-containing protein n=1 Tax=Butyricimonas sp. TaxID=1969738 RepID=UPI0025BC7A9D|nr:DUF4133 domain-containing protein [Butyricimonas sp.]